MQVTPGYTEKTGTESSPNTICAFQEGDAQFPCDPGCCAGQTKPTDTKTETTATATATETTIDTPTLIMIIVFSIIGFILLGLLLFFLYRKKVSTNSRNGFELFKRV